MVKKFLTLALLAAASCSAQTAVTVTRADGTVLNGPGGTVSSVTPVPLGISMGCYGAYGSCQITKNLLAGTGNAGGEPVRDTVIWVQPLAGTGTAGTAGTNTWSTQGMYVPTGGTARLQATWTGGTDTVVHSGNSAMAANCAQTITNVTLNGSEGTEVTGIVFASTGTCGGTAAGDTHILSGVVITPANGSAVANLNSVSTYASTGASVVWDTATPLDGLASYRLVATASGSGAFLTFGFDGGSADRFVSMDGIYTFTAKVRLNSGPGTFNVVIQRAETSGPAGINCTTATMTATGTAATVTATCTGTENTQRPNSAAVTAVVSDYGSDIDVDDVTLTKTSGQDATNTSVFRDEYVNGLKAKWYAGKHGPYRFGPQIQNGETYANWCAATGFTAIQTGFNIFGGPAQHPRCYDYLKLVEVLGATMYMHLPMNVTVPDAISYEKYLFSTISSDAEVVTRTAQGHSLPYCGPTGTISMCSLSFGNEGWNSAEGVNGGNMPRIAASPDSYTQYMQRQGVIWAAVRAQSSFQPTYARLISNAQYQGFNGWSTELAAMPANGRPDAVELAPYMSAYFSSPATPESTWRAGISTPFGQIENSSSSLALVLAEVRSDNLCGPSGTTQCQATIYEEGPNDLSSCGNQGFPACQPSATALADVTALQIIDAGAGQGVMLGDEYLENLSSGFVTQNYFASTEFGGNGTTPNATGSGPNYQDYVWGAAVDYGGATATLDGTNVRARPQMLVAQVVNTGIIGKQVACSNNAGTYAQAANPGYASIYPAVTVPTLNTRCFQDGAGTFSIVIVNRSTTQAFAMAVAGTNSTLGAVTVTQFAPSTLNTLNEAAATVPTNAVPTAPTYNAPANLSAPASSSSSPAAIAIPANSVTTIVYTATGSGVIYQMV